jgi:hypothetical protein
MAEALDYMEKLGFRLANVWPVIFDPADRISVLEVDSLFRRTCRAGGSFGAKGRLELHAGRRGVGERCLSSR